MRKAILSTVLACAFAAHAQTVEISVSNPATFSRDNEIVEVDETAVKSRLGSRSFVLRDNKGNEIAWQATHDGKIIFPVTLSPGETVVYVAEAGEASPVSPLVYGRLFKERADDMTWENDHAAYRAYGPALQKNGERGFGYDIWTKSVAEPVIEKRYLLNNRKGISFHKDHGEGMDVYTVGPTLGGGTAALLDADGSILYPWSFSDYLILDNGPLRFKVMLIYPPNTAEKGIPATETRVITLDAGDWLNRTDVTYHGLPEPRDIVAGQVVHRQNPEGYVLDPENGVTAYADLTENAEAGNGTIFVGTVAVSDATPVYLPLQKAVGDAVGHAVLKGTVENGQPFTYYWGSGWSKGGMENIGKWTETLRHKRRCLLNPITVAVSEKP
ncbi:MAG: DUF4861 domain-containing protein [Muribaculaceae bacterium]|nr:DUF4861 domain-containing protein [Muribaculaceae bacterium]